MIIFCILHQIQFKIHIFALINSEVSVYVFIDKSFAQQHNISFHSLIYLWRLQSFNDQIIFTGNITHVTEIIMMIKGYTERLFLYIIKLNQYSIVIDLPWFHYHAIDVNFEYNILIMFFFLSCLLLSIPYQSL